MRSFSEYLVGKGWGQVWWLTFLFSLGVHLVRSSSRVSMFRRQLRSSQCYHPVTLPFVAHVLCVPSIHIVLSWKGISISLVDCWRIHALRWFPCTCTIININSIRILEFMNSKLTKYVRTRENSDFSPTLR